MRKNWCKVHGEMNLENAYACNNPNGTIRLRCKECCNVNRIKVYYRNQEENIKKAGEWKKANRDRVNEQTRINRHKDIELTRDKEASRRKGLSLDHYYAMTEEQNNKCAICKEEEKRKNRAGELTTRLCIDHDHKTGKVRALLCHDCNTGIGKFKDSIDLLQSAIDYLKKHEVI